MKCTLLKPKNWNDFEDLCFHLWRQIWNDPNAQHNGRPGHKQDGVDIVGKAPFAEKYSGVQCKGKNTNYNSELTTKEIDKECDKAKSFETELGSFIVATTSNRDPKIQKHCREIVDAGKYKFDVTTWSWDDIEEELQCRPELMELFYPNSQYPMDSPNEIKVSMLTHPSRLHAFFTRPNLLICQHNVFLKILQDVAVELFTNVFEHGRASYFGIRVEDRRKIIFRDNGTPFDSSTLLNSTEKRGGSISLKHADNYFTFYYQYNDGENVLELVCKEDNIKKLTNESRTFYLTMGNAFNRATAQAKAIQDINTLSPEVKRIIVDIKDDVNPSACIPYINTMLNNTENEKIVKVYTPDGLFYKEFLEQEYNDDQRIKIVPKV